MGSLLQIKLPKRPLPKPSQLDNLKTQGRYFFQIYNLINAYNGETIKNVRSAYARPFKVEAAGPAAPTSKAEVAKVAASTP